MPACLSAAEDGAAKIGLIGDSTVCDYLSPPLFPTMKGWGQMLPEFLKDDVIVLNEAKSGASTKSFPKENWDRILAARPAFVFIQFGHNDQKQGSPDLFADAATDYRDNLKRYIGEALAVGITPILVTPVCRRTFLNGKLSDALATYAEAVRAVGAERNVPVIDLHASSAELFESLGDEGSEGYTVNKRINPDAPSPDLTHFTEAGAREMARLVVEGFPEDKAALKALRRF